MFEVPVNERAGRCLVEIWPGSPRNVHAVAKIEYVYVMQQDRLLVDEHSNRRQPGLKVSERLTRIFNATKSPAAGATHRNLDILRDAARL